MVLKNQHYLNFHSLLRKPISQAQKNAEKRAKKVGVPHPAKHSEPDKGGNLSARLLPPRDLATKYFGKYLDPNADLGSK